MAVPYASAVSSTGTDLTFTLNEDAADVTLMLEGGGSQSLGAMTMGTHTVSVPTPGNHQIKVTHSAAAGWTQISTDGTSTSFYVPVGVSVNRNKNSPNYGSVYVSNAVAGTTAFGRATNDGLYRLRADMSEVNNGTAGVDWSGTAGPWKSAIGTDDRVYVINYSADLVHDIAPDLSSASQLIDASNRTANQWVGSVVVEGTQADGNRKIYTVNPNYNDAARKGLIQYDLGSNAAATPGDTGTQYIGPDYYLFYPYDFVRDSAGDWYGTQYRYDSTGAEAVAKFLDAAPPINTAAWQTAAFGPGGEVFNGAYCLDIHEENGWVAYGNYYDGWVHIFDMADGSYITGFDAGSRIRDISFDAAGNLYTVDNLTEWLKVWSPGGDTMMSTPFTIISEPTAPSPDLDIKPGSCPNPVNVKSRGKLPIALTGGEAFDVTMIDYATLALGRADGVGGSVAPLAGPPGPHTTIDDVATPFQGETCDCHEMTGDGIDDLAMKFSTPDVVATLELDVLAPGETVELVVSGNLLDGTPFEASDCIWLVPPADSDGDGDVDQADFGHFQTCITGPGHLVGVGCEDADLDGDLDVDLDDFGVFQGCVSGADELLDPSCAS
jgi:hypothetical protein